MNQTHSLMPMLTNVKLLKIAARQCMRRSSSSGIDRVSWKEYRENLAEKLGALSDALRLGSWNPSELRNVQIRLITGKEFTIYIPVVEDRIVQRAFLNIIEPILEKYFQDYVFGFRPNRSRITALNMADNYLNESYRYVVNIDVAKVSEGPSVEEIIRWLKKYIHDGTFLSRLVIVLNGLPYPIAPGSVLSPLLINLRLSQIDNRLKDKKIVRFADNYGIFCHSLSQAEEEYINLEILLEGSNMKIAKKKSSILIEPNIEDLFLIA